MNTNRLLAIDVAKGIAIILMIVLHLIYLLSIVGIFSQSVVESLVFILCLRAVAITFIALSTIVLWSASEKTGLNRLWFRKVAKQVLKLTLSGALVSMVTYFAIGDLYVRFGILQLLAATTLINGVLFRLRLPRIWYAIFGCLVIVFGNWLMLRALPIRGWEWLGIVSTDFTSIDYVPLFPWLGVTWLAANIAPFVLRAAISLQEKLATAKHFYWLQWCGRHSLTLYLIHIPVLLGLLLIIQRFF